LSNVQLVPQLGGNLLLVAQVIHIGYMVALTSEKFTISTQGISFEGEQEGNLYYLQIQSPTDMGYLGLATNTSLPDMLEVWHRRLGQWALDKTAVNYLSHRVSDIHVKAMDEK